MKRLFLRSQCDLIFLANFSVWYAGWSAMRLRLTCVPSEPRFAKSSMQTGHTTRPVTYVSVKVAGTGAN